MDCQLYQIDPRLNAYVKSICTMSCEGNIDSSHVRILPDACVEVFLNYTDTPIAIIGNEMFSRSIITARTSRPTEVMMRKGAGCIAICFHPGGAYRFFKFGIDTLRDSTVLLSEVWEGAVEHLEEKLAGACNNQIRSDIVQDYLIERLKLSMSDSYVNCCLEQINVSATILSVTALVNLTGLSQRQLCRKFQHCLGLSPKEYLRVHRFIRSLEYLKNSPTSSLTEVAYASGYYDQSHFNRDYHTYAGYSPGQVIKSDSVLF